MEVVDIPRTRGFELAKKTRPKAKKKKAARAKTKEPRSRVASKKAKPKPAKRRASPGVKGKKMRTKAAKKKARPKSPGKRKMTSTKSIYSIRHKDTRVNIPTEELRDFVAEDEASPKMILYPRDPSLDPQLVWQGKDEQDAKDLQVPVVPIYIQEKIHAQALIEDLRQQSSRAPGSQADLFGDFNGIEDFEKKIEFYQHKANWSNRMILGDSLVTMTSLAEKEGLKGKVQMVYVDPPYGIKFGSNWQVSTRGREIRDGKAEHATRQPEQIRAFRDTWSLGVHSYLAYLRDRLRVARDLLSETGSVFVQIGDENVHLVRCLLDEVFGSDQFVSQIAFATTTGRGARLLDNSFDMLLWYARDVQSVKYRQLHIPKADREQYFSYLETPDGSSVKLSRKQILGEESIPPGRRFLSDNLTSQGETATGSKPYSYEGTRYVCPPGRHWRVTREGLDRLAVAGRLFPYGRQLRVKTYLDDNPVSAVGNIWQDVLIGSFVAEKIYVVQTSERVIERCILMTTDPGDLVLDPTCGSGTTAYAAELWGRRWITIDTSRVALALARTRVMGAKYPYYLLADSQEGIRREAELTGKVPPAYKAKDDIRRGFVCRRVPRVTLKSIANNPDIKEGVSRQEVEAAVARVSDQTVLFDQPYEDPKRIRVTGPFSVESLSPHRVPAAEMDTPASEGVAQDDSSRDFASMIIENLKRAGVQNTRKNERLKFNWLEQFPGSWLHAKGEYTESDKKTKTVAISIGPEHGTLGPQHVKEAAKEAVQGVGFDLLVVCGFAFDPHVSEEVKRYGGLDVLPARMNPDLAMGDELLKKTGAGNLFMVFGEPDVDIRKQKDGKMVVEIKGVDVYDPTTGQVRNSSTDDIACWFIDTDYNGESFFVRHAYFTGADEPYKKLQRTLRAEIDEDAWASLYSTKSRPFDNPAAGKIAVKVINHYGDEVLKVFEV